ncbi:MAG: hypothetical protein IT368_17830, partial [Candidatus Hydrogenedentes bacterium]|nr:hypothetical protein [Candidatus Hydrogenedentota bacterium]
MLNTALEKKITSLQAKAFVVGAAGVVITLAALLFTPVVTGEDNVYQVTTGFGARFFQALHIAWITLLGLPLGGLAIIMLRPLAGGAWSVVLQRVCEAASRTIWVFFFVGIFIMGLGSSYLFPWVHEEILHHNHIIGAKVHYLNLGFFWIRYVVYFAIWYGLMSLFNGASKRLDETGNQVFAVRMQRFSAPGLVLFFLSVTFAMTDWAMSLEPEWFSTIYGPFGVVSVVLLTLSAMIIALTRLDQWEPLKSRITAKHYHDIGNLMLGFVILWSYMAFAQFLITWSGNLPEEIGWYMHRKGGGLTVVTVMLMLFHFLVPMIYLLFRQNKK